MKIIKKKIEQLSNDPANARKHDERNISAIVGSLRRFGQQKPIVIDSSGVVRAGNGTLEAARQLGWTEIDCVVTDLEGSDAIAYAIADNRTSELAAWDDDILAAQLHGLLTDDEALLEAAGFDEDELAAMLNELGPEKQITEDEVPEPPVDPITKPGDLWILGSHRVLCGDSTKAEDVKRLVGGDLIGCVITDPPYGISHSGKGIHGSVSANDFGRIEGDKDTSVARLVLELCFAMFPGVAFVVWGANYFPSAFPDGFGWIVWDKEREGETFSGAELAFSNVGVRVDVFRHQWHGMIKASERGESRVHATQKPIAVMAYCIKKAVERDSIYDPFIGSGTTLIAAEQLNRKCFGMEISPQYVDVCVKRWENLTGEKAICQSATPE
jgi:DNA modification methylase